MAAEFIALTHARQDIYQAVASWDRKENEQLKAWLRRHGSILWRPKMQEQHTSQAALIRAKLERKHYPTGSKSAAAKLTSAQVLEIRHLYATTDISPPALADLYEITVHTIRDILHRRTWKHLD